MCKQEHSKKEKGIQIHRIQKELFFFDYFRGKISTKTFIGQKAGLSEFIQDDKKRGTSIWGFGIVVDFLAV